ncbi:MAG: cysteine synthase A [Campylobacterota bacterium]|nr:cysteine synthase A [Campylobacterota bacterium]
MKIAQNIGDLVGDTPIIKLNNIDRNLPANIYAKCEFMNPTSSVKDRIGMNMIKTAIYDGRINKDTHIIEPTSGNTGIALASQCASLGLKLTLTMPESMSIERRKILKALGANVILTPKELGMQGSINKVNEMVENEKNAITLQQFSNPANPAVHRETTALEILRDMDADLDIFIAAVGTGGTLTGTSTVLKEKISDLHVIAVEPVDSPVLSGGQAGPHKIQGIGAGFVPDVLNTKIYDEILQVSNDDAIQMAKNLMQKEGLFVGISAGANVHAAVVEALKEENKNKKILTILCDTAERYLSTELFEE